MINNIYIKGGIFKIEKMKRLKISFLCTISVVILFILILSQISIAQDAEEVTGITVYRVYPFKSIEMYELKTIFVKNYSYVDFSIDVPWSTPFSFREEKKEEIISYLESNSYISQESIVSYSRKGNISQNEYIYFQFKNKPKFGCVIFPTMLVGIGELTETGEYITVSDMNSRRQDFLSFFEDFIIETHGFKIYFQQTSFFSGEPLTGGSMIWTRIIRATPNFNTFSDEQLMDFLYFNYYDFEKIKTDDYRQMALISSFSNGFIDEVVLFDGYNLQSSKTYYNYPLDRNINIIRLHMLTELNYILLPYAINEVSELQENLDSLENELTYLNGKTSEQIKQSGLLEDLTYYKSVFRELQHLDLNLKLRNTDSIYETSFGPNINEQHNRLSAYLLDINTQYYFLREYYNNLLNSAYSGENLNLQFSIFIATIIGLLLTIGAPYGIDWYRYNFSKPNFSVHFKPTSGKTFIEKKLQEINILPNKKQLIWLMLHNNGKIIKDNWYCIVDFEKGFSIIPIEETKYKDVDFLKHYTIQKKYNVAHYSSTDVSPLFPHNETYVFPMVVKTPKKEKYYNVNVTIFTGNHKNKFEHHLRVKIEK